MSKGEEMSFEHRFGVGIGGSHEDPYIPPWCENCPDAVYNRCPRTPKFIKECEEFSKEMEENRGSSGKANDSV